MTCWVAIVPCVAGNILNYGLDIDFSSRRSRATEGFSLSPWERVNELFTLFSVSAKIQNCAYL